MAIVLEHNDGKLQQEEELYSISDYTVNST